MLFRSPGYLGKQVWIDPQILDEVVLVIHWESLEHWQAIPSTFLDEVENKFSEKMGKDNYKMIESRQYQIRKFPVNKE